MELGSFPELLGERPLLVVVSGPSGSGKTSVVNALLRRRRIRKSVSATTREPRQGEIDGVSYHFFSVEQFQRRIREGAFAEWAQYRSHYYGTLRETVETAFRNGEDLLLEIDVQGGAQIRARYRDAVMVFIMAPGIPALEQRLARRATEDEAIRRQRLEAARGEIRAATIYDYVIVNDEDRIEEAAKALDAVIEAEKRRLTLARCIVLSRSV